MTKTLVVNVESVMWHRPEMYDGHRPHIFITSGINPADEFDIVRVSDGSNSLIFKRNSLSKGSKFRYIYAEDPRFVAYIL